MDNKKLIRIIIIDILIIIILICMFCFVKCQKRTEFTHKGEYKTVSLCGTWYKVDVDTVTKFVIKKHGDYEEKNMAGEVIKKGSYEVGNHVIKLDGEVFSLNYIDEAKELEEALGKLDESEYELRKYFIVNNGKKDIYYFSTQSAAADQIEDNCVTNEYYKEVGLFDDNGFAVDGDNSLVAYIGEQTDITVPSEVSIIEENAFASDYDRAVKTKTVKINSNVTTIKSNAFAFSNIQTVYIAEGLKQIEPFAFADSNIKEIHFPRSVANIGESIFDTNIEVNGLKIYCKAGSSIDKYFKTHRLQGNYEIIYE